MEQLVERPRLLLTVEEAAERIGICRSNMFKLIRQGKIRSVKVGRLRRVTPAALEDFVRRLAVEEDPAT
jgi:excisionase family DNA binding protein